MQKIERALKKFNHIVFLDFEGTQFSSEMIALGAVVCVLDKNHHIKKMKEPFLIYVKAKNKIGKIVQDLTGINEEKLKKDGVSFSKAMAAFRKYCGFSFTRSLFVTFGNNDMRILNQSIVYNFDAPKDICSQIQKNYFDFQPLIAEFIRDDKYNPMSLLHYLELFNIKESGTAHNPKYDAINLALLYDSFLKNRELVLDEYLKVLPRSNGLPVPVREVISRLSKGETVTGEEFKQIAKEYIEK